MIKNEINHLEPRFNKEDELVKASMELYKLLDMKKSALLISIIFSRGLVLFILTMFITIVNIGLSLWISHILGESNYRFICIAGLYTITGSILYFYMRKRISKPISNTITNA